jgi:hypothetical protein
MLKGRKILGGHGKGGFRFELFSLLDVGEQVNDERGSVCHPCPLTGRRCQTLGAIVFASKKLNVAASSKDPSTAGGKPSALP